MLTLAHLLGYEWFIYINLDTTGKKMSLSLMRALPVAYKTEGAARAVLAQCEQLNPELRRTNSQLFKLDRLANDWNIMRIGQLGLRYALATPAEIAQFNYTYALPEELCTLLQNS